MINKKTILLSFLLVTLLFISGCGTINMTMDIKSDWTYDGGVEVKGEEMFVNIVKEAITSQQKETGMVLNEIQTEDGVTYKFTDSLINPSVDRGAFSSLGIKKEFKFPYYYYTLSLNNEGTEESESNEFVGALSMNFIIKPYGKITDTNGVLLGEKKDSVRFDMTKTKIYSVTFRKFFLFEMSNYKKVPEREPKAYEQTEQIQTESQELLEEQEETKEYSSADLQYLEVSCSFPDNWDSDADDDGITLDVSPISKDGSIIPIEGSLTINAYVLEQDEDTWKYYKGDLVNTRYVPDVKGKERLEYFSDYSGYRIMLKWDDTKPYSSTKEDYGIVYVKFVTKDGKSFEAKTGDDYPSCQIRP